MSDQLCQSMMKDHLDVVMDLMQKYNLQMVPVKDTDGVLSELFFSMTLYMNM